MTTTFAPSRTLLLIRHGETDWNRLGRWQGQTDIPLNDTGRAQARALLAKLQGLTLHVICSSDLKRASETASILSGSFGLPEVHLHPGLRERSYGVWEGLTRHECEARYPDIWNKHVDGTPAEPPGSESRVLVGKRMAQAIEQLLVQHLPQGGTLVAISHGGAMRAYFEHVCGRLVPPVANTAVYQLRQNPTGRMSEPSLI